MAIVVLLRAVNVGGHRTFRPSRLAAAMTELDVTSLGAAGTFVVRGKTTRKAVRETFARHLPFEAELVICGDRELAAAAGEEALARHRPAGDVKTYVTILAKKPRSVPDLPVEEPPGRSWQVRIVAVSGKMVVSHHRRHGKKLVYPNEVVEKTFGVPATSRNANTIAKALDAARKT